MTLRMLATCTLVIGALVADAPAQPAPPAGRPVPADGTLRFKSYLFSVPGKIKLTAYEDVNGDSLIDVIAIHGSRKASEPARNLVIYIQQADGFSLEPDIRYRVPDDVALVDVGDVNSGTPGDELLLLSGDAVAWQPLASPAPGATGTTLEGSGTRLVGVESAFAHADPLRVAFRNFARPLKDATEATLFVPHTTGYRVYQPDDGYAQGTDFAVPHLHEIAEEAYTVHVSNVSLADVNGDGADDLALSHLDQLRVYFAEGGGFHPTPDVDLNLGILTSEDYESEEGLASLMGFQLEDLNGDALADLFVWKRVIAKKAVINDRQQYQVYRNRGGSFDVVPDQAFILKSLNANPTLKDLNGDKRPDLITGTMDFSIPNLVKMLVTGRLDIDLNFFLAGPSGFPDAPDETRTFKIKFSLSSIDEFFVPAVEEEGDYNGDDVRDFLLQTSDEEVEIFFGRRGDGGLYEKKASARLKTAATSESFVKDMNGDGRDDIAFDRFPDRKPFDPGWINVLLSQ